MDVAAVLEKAGAMGGTGRVFSEPIERDGTTVILAAKVGGGGGGGEGPQDSKEGNGHQSSGLGYGYGAKPLGAFIIQSGRVRWRPAIDANRVIAGMQWVMATALLTARALVRRRHRRPLWRRGWRLRH